MKAPIANHVQIAAALKAVSNEYQVLEQSIIGRSKKCEHSEARMWFWFVLRTGTGANCISLARLTGHDRTSVVHACAKAIDWMRIYPSLRARYDRIVTAFNLACIL